LISKPYNPIFVYHTSRLMRKRAITPYILCIIILVAFVGCTTSKQATTSSSRRSSPRFLNNISMKGRSSKVDMTVAGNQHEHIKNEDYEIPEAEPEEPKPNAQFERLIVIRKGRSNNESAINSAELNDNSYSLQKYASLLGTVPNALHNLSLYNFIDEWYGVRYRLGGNDKSGIDCSAFVQRLYENVFGVNLVRTACEQFNTCKMLWQKDTMKEGDLVFFYSYSYSRARRHHKARIIGKHIAHVGIYLANSYFVHASTSNGVIISSLRDDYWAAKFAGAGIVPKG
jgi:hypothetical protein